MGEGVLVFFSMSGEGTSTVYFIFHFIETVIFKFIAITKLRNQRDENIMNQMQYSRMVDIWLSETLSQAVCTFISTFPTVNVGGHISSCYSLQILQMLVESVLGRGCTHRKVIIKETRETLEHSRDACLSQIQYLSKSTKITKNTEMAMLSNTNKKQIQDKYKYRHSVFRRGWWYWWPWYSEGAPDIRIRLGALE